jgi:hypothetical protein
VEDGRQGVGWRDSAGEVGRSQSKPSKIPHLNSRDLCMGTAVSNQKIILAGHGGAPL